MAISRDDDDKEAPAAAAFDLQATLVTYQVLMQRFVSNADMQWRTPTLVITTEAFVFAGIFAIRNSPAVLILGLVGVYVSVAGALTMRRIRLLALIDRQMLDACEYFLAARGLVPEGWPVGIHRLKVRNRAAVLAQSLDTLPRPVGEPPSLDWSLVDETDHPGLPAQTSRRLDRFVIEHSPPSQTWLFVLLSLGVAAFAISVYEAFLS